MKLAQVDHPATRIGLVGAESNFTIKATAKAFKILSSGLYKDKIGAILRELSANAYDAHIAAKCPEKPFDLHLPTDLEPFLSIRDYGLGLSHDDIMELYTTYFESTKTDSNDYVGALGLGSKSPFSYVRSFTIISRHSGMEITYDAVIGTDGLPTIAQRARHPMNSYDPTGLEVVVPVKSTSDAREFLSKAPAIYAYYPVRPKLTGAKIIYADRKIALEGQGYRVTDRYDHTARAIMGVVSYPISLSGLYPEVHDAPAKIAQIVRSGIDIDFPMGALDITAGREELSYDPETIATLIARLETIYDDLHAQCEAEFAQCKTVREGHAKYHELFQQSGYALSSILGRTFVAEVNGRQISSSNFTAKLCDFPNTTFRWFRNNNRGGVKYVTTHRYDEVKKDHYTNDYTFNILSDPSQIRFLVNEQPGTNWSRRIFEYRANNRRQNVILIEPDTPEALQAVKDHFDGFTFDDVSVLPKPLPGQKTKARLRKLSSSYQEMTTIPNCFTHAAWPSATTVLEEGGIYVLTKHCKFQRNDVEADTDFSKAYVAMRDLGLFSTRTIDIFAVPATESKSILASEDWTSFWEFIDAPTQEYLKAKPDSIDRINQQRGYQRFTNTVEHYWKIDALFSGAARALGNDHPLSKFVTGMNRGGGSMATTHIANLVTVLGIDIPPPPPEYDLLAQWNAIHEAYPMLNYIPRPQHGNAVTTPADDLINYIKIMDATPKRLKPKVKK